MRSRSRTSHSRPYSAAICAGALGQQRGRQAVGGLVDQVAGEVLRLGDDARRVAALLSEAGCASGTTTEKRSTAFCRLCCRSCSGPARSRREWRLRRPPRHGPPRRTGSGQEGDAADALGLQQPQRGARHLAQFGRVEASRLPRADHQQPFARFRPGARCSSVISSALPLNSPRGKISIQPPASSFGEAGGRFFPLEGHAPPGRRLPPVSRGRR